MENDQGKAIIVAFQSRPLAQYPEPSRHSVVFVKWCIVTLLTHLIGEINVKAVNF